VRHHQQDLISPARRRSARPLGASICAGGRLSRGAAVIIAFTAAAILAGCSELKPSSSLFPDAGPMAVARLIPKNGSTVRGIISFTQRGNRVAIAGNFVELFPGSHSIYIHAVGNCGSPNAASAGPVWHVGAAPTGGKRTGDLPELFATPNGYANLQMSSSILSVGTGEANDVIGHSVVIHSDFDPDPKAEFGVPNGWLACGVIERSSGFDLKKYF
jgi:superoxide dismutase, Cu-Zn family